MSALYKMLDLLDEYIEKAMTWPAIQAQVFDGPAHAVTVLENELEKARTSAAGRGVAECITLLTAPHFNHADQVIGLAVQRYQAKQAGEVVDPYNFGPTGPMPKDALYSSLPEAAPVAAVAAPVAPVATVPAPAPVVAAPVAVAAPATADADAAAFLAKYTEAELVNLRTARDQFGVETMATMFGITEEVAKAL